MQNALPNLKSSLDKVRAIVDDIDAHAQDALKDAIVLARHETTLCAATVILSGFLESFLREIAEEMISDICRRSVPFNQLPSKIRVTHYWDGALHLREMARQERKADPVILAETADAARRLASVDGAQLPYEIVWEAFADTQANPGPDEIGDFLRRFDVNEPLVTLATAMKMPNNRLALNLRSFMKVRNECAHTGRAVHVPTTSAVRDYCGLVEEVGAGILAIFQNILAAAPYAAPPQTAQPAPAVPSSLPG